MEKREITSRHRIKRPVEERLPLNVRSSGHAVVRSDWEHPTGFVDRHNVYWGIVGTIRYRVNGRECVLHADKVIFYPLDSDMTSSVYESEGEYRWLTLDGPVANELFEYLGIEFYKPIAAVCPCHLMELLMQSFDDPTSLATMNAEMIAYELLLSIKGLSRDRLEDREISEAKRIIDGEFSDPNLDVSAVAERVKLDRTVLSRRFKTGTGMSPSKYLQSKRLMLALKYLEEGCTTVQTSNLTGYNDPAYFARSFKRHFGLSPQAWRESNIHKL